MSTKNADRLMRTSKAVLFLMLMAACAIGVIGFGSEARAATLPAVKGYWPFNGSAIDASGSGANGTVVGSVTYPAGHYAQCIAMTGNSYVNLANPSVFNNMTSFTLSAWIYPTANNSAIISKVTPNRDFVFQVDANGRLNLHITINISTYYHCTSTTVVPLNTWSHVSAVVTPYSVILYRNASVVASRTLSNIRPAWTGTDMAIGRMSSYSYFNGRIDDVRIYNTALDSSQILELYSPTPALPTSGYEIPYEPSLWNDAGTIQYSTNCYAYAINLQYDPITGESFPLARGSGYCLQPGELSSYWLDWYSALNDLSASEIQYACSEDAYYTGGIFYAVGRYEACPSGTYKVVLVTDPGWDYHWYRQNPNGTWSHKPGTTAVTNVDGSGALISDPYVANRGGYTNFVGYFAVQDTGAGPSLLRTALTESTVTEQPIAIGEGAATIQSTAAKRTDLKRTSFSTLKRGMGANEILPLVGAPHRQVGSGLLIYEYDLENGSKMMLNYGPHGAALWKARIVHPDGTKEMIVQ